MGAWLGAAGFRGTTPMLENTLDQEKPKLDHFEGGFCVYVCVCVAVCAYGCVYLCMCRDLCGGIYDCVHICVCVFV